ncbi:MAG: hypothetical protein Q8S73_11595 [Deltaproteobacteria bacterium]|nr:hypothetical protein [Deltaproteobacteria bacterium]
MSLETLKKHTSAYFKSRKLHLRNMSKANVTASDDLFELFVLAVIAEHSSNVSFANVQAHRYVVACAPSPNWNAASHIVLQASNATYCARTGLQVTVDDGTTAEVDVLIVKQPQPPVGPIASKDIVAAFECKVYSEPIDMPTAESILGKAVRLWGPALSTSMLSRST